MKKLIIAILALTLMFSTVVLADSITLSGTSSLGSLNSSATAQGTFTVTNAGANQITQLKFNQNVIFTGTNGNFTKTVTYTPATVDNFASAAQQAVSYTFTVPSNSEAKAGSYTGSIEISNHTGSNLANFTPTLSINTKDSVAITTPSISSVIQSETATTNFTITNDGNTDLTTVTITPGILTSGTNTISSSGYTLSKTAIAPLNWKEAESIQVSFTAPGNQAAGTYTGNLSVNIGSETKIVPLTITVVASSYTVTATSPVITWARGVSGTETTTLEIENKGNKDLTLSITPEDLISGSLTILSSKVTISPSSLSLAKNEKKNVTISVSGLASNQDIGTYTGKINMKDSSGSMNSTTTLSVKVRAPIYDLTFTPSSVKIGDSNTVRNNTNFVSTSFTVKNIGDYVMNAIQIKSKDINSAYNVTYSTSGEANSYSDSVTINLGKNDQETIYVRGLVIENMQSGVSTIGSIIAENSNYNETTSLQMESKGFLEITDSDIWVGSDSSDNFDNGDTINDIKPGDHIKMRFKIKNLFDDNTDNDIEDVSVQVTVKDIDDGDDIEEESETDDIKTESTGTFYVEFDIPEKVDQDNFDVEIQVTGDDQNGADHEIIWNIEFEINKEKHDVRIERTALSEAEMCVKSNEQTLYVDVRVANYGKEDEEEVKIKVSSTDLSYSKEVKDIELNSDFDDDDNDHTESFSIPVPANKKGTVTIRVTTFYDETKLSDSQDVQVTLKDCGITTTQTTTTPSNTGSTTDSGSTGTINIVQGGGSSTTTATTGTSSQPPISVSKQTDFRDSDSYIYMLVGGFVLVLAIVVVVLFLLI